MKIFTPDDFKKYFYASLFLAIICLIMAIVAIGESGQADLYVKTSFNCENCSGGTYHQGRVGESISFKDAKQVRYQYEKEQDYGTGATTQTSELAMEGGEASYWNYHRTWTEEDIAGSNQLKLSIGKIGGSYYGKNGMNISYNEADGAEEFESTLTIEAENTTIELSVIDWKTGKPVDIETLDLTGELVLNQIVKLSEPIVDELGFCESLDRDVILSDESGIYVVPVGYTVDENKKLVRTNTTGLA